MTFVRGELQGPGQMGWSSFVAAREAALADGKSIRLSVRKQEKETCP